MDTPAIKLPQRQYFDQKNDILHAIWDQVSRINGKTPGSLLNRSVKGGFSTSTEDLLYSIVGELSLLNIPVTVKAFGAVGDGIADDTQAFLDAFKSNRTVLIPETGAFYKVSTKIVVAGINKLTIQATGAKILSSDLTKATWLFQNCTDISIDGGDWGYATTPTANATGSEHVFEINTSQRVMLNRVHVLNSPEMGVAITMSNQVTVQNSLIENCYRDGTYAHYSANVKYLNNTYRNIKDDAMSFHDYGRDSERTFINSLGYNQANGLIAQNCTVENAYQGFTSVAGSGISVTKCTFRQIVGAGVALMNQKLLWLDGTAKMTDAAIEGNSFYNCCSTTPIMGTVYQNFGQGSSGRASITVVSLGDGNALSLTEPKRSSNVRIRNNFVLNSGALGLGCYTVDGLTVSGNTFQNCTVLGNTLGGNAVEFWECTGFVQESVNTVIDNRNPVQHVRGYNFSGVSGTLNNWVIVGRTTADGLIVNSPSLVDISGTGPVKIVPLIATQGTSGSNSAYAFPHNVGYKPQLVTVQPGNATAGSAVIDHVEWDASSIVVYYKSNVAAGTAQWNCTIFK